MANATVMAIFNANNITPMNMNCDIRFTIELDIVIGVYGLYTPESPRLLTPEMRLSSDGAAMPNGSVEGELLDALEKNVDGSSYS